MEVSLIKSDPKSKRFHQLWLENGGSDISEQRICDQRSQIQKKGWLTSVEMEVIQREIDGTPEVKAN